MLQKNPAKILIKKRQKWISLSVFAVAGLIIFRLFVLQVIRADEFRDAELRQQGIINVESSSRGQIFFKEDNSNRLVTAATNQKGYLLFIDNRYIKNYANIYVTLNNITPLDRAVYDKIIDKKNDPYEVLRQKISYEEGEAIKVLGLAGVGLLQRSWRYYPGDNFASHVVGFVSGADSDSRGQYGAEKFFQKRLVGGDGGSGFAYLFGEQLKRSDSGEDIVLTIEPTVQRALEDQLNKLYNKWHPMHGGGIIVDPMTGQIRAMAAFPTFNPNEYFKEKKLEEFLNPLVEHIYELGSVFKPLTMAAAIDKGVLGPETTYIDQGEIRVDDRVIKNFDEKARGVRTMTQVLEESLNTGAVFAMQKLGGENLRAYFENFGLGEKLGIDLPGEVSGNLSNLKSGRAVEFATASFGQGIAVTPLEFTMALASLANGGNLMRPYVEAAQEPRVIRRTISREASNSISRMLVDVVDNALVGGQAKKLGYSVAAKTGTAQISKGNGGGYLEGEFLHSFFGYFPAYEPRFLIFLFLDRPQGVKYASQSLTDSFRALVDFLINYYTIAPDRAATRGNL